MANAKMYQINTPAVEAKPKYVGGLKGQAKVVMDALKAQDSPVLAKDLASTLTFEGSRQDPYRVTLYYILVFKSKGLILATEQKSEDIDEVEVSVEEQEETISAS